MKVTYQTCCGVGVRKSLLVATIVKTTSGIEPSYQKKRFSIFNNPILEFEQRLLNNDCHDVCMGSIDKYWVSVSNLSEDDTNVVIANPKWVEAAKDNKDDTKDSKWIGDLFRLGLVRGSHAPCKKTHILRGYTRYCYRLISCRSNEENRHQNVLIVCNVALDSVVSDVFGKSFTSIIDYLLKQSSTSINREETVSKLLGSLKSKEDAVMESVEGYQMVDAQKYRMRPTRAHIDCITTEIGTDVPQFSSSKRLCYWTGLTPGSNELTDEKKFVRITRAGAHLKPALVQCIHAAVKSDKSPYYKRRYDSLVKRRGKKRAIIATACMILTAIYQMTPTGKQWNPNDLYKIDMPVALAEKQKAKTVKQAKKLLQQERLLPPGEPLAS